jgi:hypothetical protein
MFNGPEAIFQGSNGDHEITAARIQHACERRIIRVRNVLRGRTLLLSRNVGVQNSNGARKVGDQHPDLLRRLTQGNATLSPDLTVMFHFIPPGCPVGQKPDAALRSGEEASKEDGIKNGMELEKVP